MNKGLDVRTILDLQRSIGNQQINRLLQVHGLDPSEVPHVQEPPESELPAPMASTWSNRIRNQLLRAVDWLGAVMGLKIIPRKAQK